MAALFNLAVSAHAATVSDSRITISGGPVTGETFTLARMYGGWFVIPRATQTPVFRRDDR